MRIGFHLLSDVSRAPATRNVYDIRKICMNILVTGATGYVGGRLVPRLVEAGHNVRVLVRHADRIAGRDWQNRVRIVECDLDRPTGLDGALEGVDAAYYLVHSMQSGKGFEKADRGAAERFGKAAAASNVRIVYLGGLQPAAGTPSAHLASRAEVGAILAAHTPTIELRAGPIIGSGSASFEMVRYLTDRLPAMVAPRWILSRVQPVAIRDVLAFLIRALGLRGSAVLDIGGDVLTFKDMMETFASVQGYKRLIVPLPVLAPGLAALWVGLVTPIPNRLAVPLVKGLIHDLVGDTAQTEKVMPDIKPIPYRRAVELALAKIQSGNVETRWSGALGGDATFDLVDWEGTIREVRSLRVATSPEAVFNAFTRLGGEKGWLVWQWAWHLRGMIDKLVGGPGLRRGRRHPQDLYPGEALDFWRVEAVEKPSLLRLRAEMRLPGKAWLQYEAVPDGGATRLVQTAIFMPKGMAGAVYWYSLYPIHRHIFSDMVNAVGKEALV